MIYKGSNQPKDNLSGAEWRPIRSSIANDLLPVIRAAKGNAAVVLCTSDYNQKIATVLRDKAYVKLKKDPIESIEHKTVLLLKKSSFPEDVYQLLRPQGSRAPRLYGLPKIHKTGVPLGSTVHIIVSTTYRLAQHLAHLLSGH
jgi:hypothetical protein